MPARILRFRATAIPELSLDPTAARVVIRARLGFDDPNIRRNVPLFLNYPRYTLSMPGGADVAGITRILPGIPKLEWTNRDELATVQRARGMTFEWRGVDQTALVLILAASFDRLSTAGSICYCLAEARAGRMFIPPEVLAQFPATGSAGGPPRSGAMLIALHLQAGIPPPVRGLDLLSLISVFANVRGVDFQ